MNERVLPVIKAVQIEHTTNEQNSLSNSVAAADGTNVGLHQEFRFNF